MKFARYLEETQTPEWKKAYIDYRGLKKRITAIRRAQDEAQAEPGTTPLLPLTPYPSAGADDHAPVAQSPEAHSAKTTPPLDEHDSAVEDGHAHDVHAHPSMTRRDSHNTGTSTGVLPRLRRRSTAASTILRAQLSSPSHDLMGKAADKAAESPDNNSHLPTSTHVSPSKRDILVGSKLPWAPGTHPPLRELLPLLVPVQRAFFDLLDHELDKVESFFCAREREIRIRYDALKNQLKELQDHHRLFHEAHPHSVAQPWFNIPVPLALPHAWYRLRHHVPLPATLPKPPSASARFGKRRRHSSDDDHTQDHGKEKSPGTSPDAESDPSDEKTISDQDGPGKVAPEVGFNRSRTEAEKGMGGNVETVDRVVSLGEASSPGTQAGDAHADFEPHLSHSLSGNVMEKGQTRAKKHPHVRHATNSKRDPEEYYEAKKTLKKAVRECYRGLEVLNNYRTLNLIGFRKALKKFEKVTHIPAQQAYTLEKIEPSAFASGANLDSMLHEMEDIFAARFARGDKKKAQARLRSDPLHKSHHFSTFRTGMLLGLGIPALVDGIYKSFQVETRAAIPSWDALLFVYGIFFVPVLFSFLIGINLLVWHNARINYIFIFELDLRTRLDHREYFEVPALLMSTLFYALWLSFSRIGESTVQPSHWPLLWLIWALFVWLNPLPIMYKPSRYWLVRNLYRQLTSGVRHVEFQDFWMGDQFCSLAFTLADLWFVGCAYSHELRNWRVCTTGPNWGPQFALAALPFFVRFVQSIRRWVDSKLTTHLINAGKYGTGLIYYLTYYLWRQHGGGHGTRFIVWIIIGVLYASYAAAWDILMDWSLMQPHARYRFLRSELIYTSHRPLYYIAMITNIIIRFEFMMYIPEKGINYVIRTFIAAMLEMLRRWQWNFFRLENEHVGNMDQYRVTREVPLPYSFDASHESDGGDEDDDVALRRSMTSASWRRRRMSAQSTIVDHSVQSI